MRYKQFSSPLNFIQAIKLKANFGRLNTKNKVIEEVVLIVPYPTLLQVKPSATVNREVVLYSCKLEKILVLHVIRFLAPE